LQFTNNINLAAYGIGDVKAAAHCKSFKFLPGIEKINLKVQTRFSFQDMHDNNVGIFGKREIG
jgi:hypothetical protein